MGPWLVNLAKKYGGPETLLKPYNNNGFWPGPPGEKNTAEHGFHKTGEKHWKYKQIAYTAPPWKRFRRCAQQLGMGDFTRGTL